MTIGNKWKMGLFGLGAAAIIGLSTTALYSNVYAQAETPANATDETPVMGLQRHDSIFAKGEDHSALLAEALGISEEALQAAVTEARNAVIDQAVADGKITQEQADQLKSGDVGRGRGRGIMGVGDDHEEALAEALGISVVELEAAKAEVQEKVLAEAVAAGEITQEEADLITARQALQEYRQGLAQSAYEETVAQAVADGAITQAQADQILSEGGMGFFGPGRFGPGMDGGRHGGHRGGPEGAPDGRRFGGPGRGQLPEGETPESSSSPLFEMPEINL